MDTVRVIIEIHEGIANITEITAPPETKVSVIIRDYDTEGADPADLTADCHGIPCFESGTEYKSVPGQPGFV